MKVILANPRGFCAGVNMAIDCVDQVLRTHGAPIYVFHEIVHNRHVVEDFKSRGVIFVESVDEVPEGALLVYSAHGISPEIRRKARTRRLVEVDATCPLVTKVHKEVLRYTRDGYKVIFVGHRNHDEAIGTIGEAPENIIVVESPEEAEQLEFPANIKLAYVTQTTLSVADANRVIDVLKRRFPKIRFPQKDDICYATTNRQAVVSEIAPEVDLVLVVGSQNSSNSLRLVERAIERGVAAHLIDDESEIDPSWLDHCESVLVTAGASAPEHLVIALLERLKQDYNGEVVESPVFAEENISFSLPDSVRRLPVLR